jgi:formate hydrogenlyase subunit 4
VQHLIALIMLLVIFHLFATAEACRARFKNNEAVDYYGLAFAISVAFCAVTLV